MVIDSLGLDRDVLAALPYTTVEFDNPTLTDAVEKSTFFKDMMEGTFEGSSAQIPMNHIVRIAAAIGDTDLPIDSGLMEELEKRQRKLDDQADEKFQKEMALLDAQIEQVKEQTKHIGEPGGMGGGGILKPAAKKGEGYTRKEQREHERTRGTAARREAKQKADARRSGGA